MNFYLNIKYSDGREDYYVLMSGERYILGSSNNCGIAIQEPGIADKHLLFICKEDGVDIKIFKNINQTLTATFINYYVIMFLRRTYGQKYDFRHILISFYIFKFNFHFNLL